MNKDNRYSFSEIVYNVERFHDHHRNGLLGIEQLMLLIGYLEVDLTTESLDNSSKSLHLTVAKL